jgi:hypothetical protein
MLVQHETLGCFMLLPPPASRRALAYCHRRDTIHSNMIGLALLSDVLAIAVSILSKKATWT